MNQIKITPENVLKSYSEGRLWGRLKALNRMSHADLSEEDKANLKTEKENIEKLLE